MIALRLLRVSIPFLGPLLTSKPMKKLYDSIRGIGWLLWLVVLRIIGPLLNVLSSQRRKLRSGAWAAVLADALSHFLALTSEQFDRASLKAAEIDILPLTKEEKHAQLKVWLRSEHSFLTDAVADQAVRALVLNRRLSSVQASISAVRANANS